MEPVLAELKEVKKLVFTAGIRTFEDFFFLEWNGMDSNLTKFLHTNEAIEKVFLRTGLENSKDILNCIMQGTDSLEVLLMADGLKMMKYMCYKNLNMAAKDPEEIDLLNVEVYVLQESRHES